MSYEVRLDPRADGQLDRMPEPLRSFALAALARLGQGPGSVSRSSASVTRGQLAEFHFNPDPATSLWVMVTFQYGADEQTLHVENVKVEYGD